MRRPVLAMAVDSLIACVGYLAGSHLKSRRVLSRYSVSCLGICCAQLAQQSDSPNEGISTCDHGLIINVVNLPK
jgi:hypothetical protein